MNICSDRKNDCIVGVDGVVCPHAEPHYKIGDCSHHRFRCTQFPGKQHRCRKFKPVRSGFEIIAGISTFIVAGEVKDAELLRLIDIYGTDARRPAGILYLADHVRVSLPKYHGLFEAFVAGMN